MGSIFSPKVPAAPTPPPMEYMDSRDEVSGTETVWVTGPDGKKTAVTRRLPLTPEQQEAEANLQRIMDENLKRIEVLSGPDYADAIPGLTDTLKAFTDYNTGLVEGNYAKASRDANRSLERRGMGDSTTGVQTQVGLQRAKAQDLTTVGQQAKLMEGDIRDQEIGRAQNLFGIAANRGDLNFARAVDGLNRQQGTQSILLNAAQNYQNMVYGGALQQQQLKYQAGQAGMQNLAAIAGLASYGFDKAGGFKKYGFK